MNTTGRPVFGVVHNSRCANCGRTYGKHCAHNERCPKVVNGTIVDEMYTRTKFKAVRLISQPRNGKIAFYPLSFSKHV